MDGDLEEIIEKVIHNGMTLGWDAVQITRSLSKRIDQYHASNKAKMEVTYDHGTISLHLWDLMDYISDEQKAKLASDYGWDSPAWEAIKAYVKGEYEPKHDAIVNRLRADFFLKNDKLEEVYADLIGALLTEIRYQTDKAEVYQTVHNQMWAWWCERNRDDNTIRDMPVKLGEYNLKFLGFPDIVAYLTSHGVNLAGLKLPEKD